MHGEVGVGNCGERLALSSYLDDALRCDGAVGAGGSGDGEEVGIARHRESLQASQIGGWIFPPADAEHSWVRFTTHG